MTTAFATYFGLRRTFGMDPARPLGLLRRPAPRNDPTLNQISCNAMTEQPCLLGLCEKAGGAG